MVLRRQIAFSEEAASIPVTSLTGEFGGLESNEEDIETVLLRETSLVN